MMRKFLVMASAAMVLLGAQAWAACGPVCNAGTTRSCNTCPKPPKMKWVTVTETVMVKCPVKRWVEEEIEVPCETTKMVPKEIECTVMVPQVEEVAGTTRKQVWEDEQYDSFEYRDVEVECQGTKKVCRTEKVCVPKKVKRRVYDEVCDPATGKMVRCPRYVFETVQVEETRKVIDQVPYTYKKCVKEKVPVVKTRRVCKWVEVPCVQKVTRMIPSTEKKTIMVPVAERTMVKKTVRKCITEYVEQPKCVSKRVQVPVEECPAPKPVCNVGCAPAKPVASCNVCNWATAPAVAPVAVTSASNEPAAPAI